MYSPHVMTSNYCSEKNTCRADPGAPTIGLTMKSIDSRENEDPGGIAGMAAMLGAESEESLIEPSSGLLSL